MARAVGTLISYQHSTLGRAQALASYRKLHEVAPKLRRIPDEYLKEIDPAALAQIEKERAAAKKAAAEKKQQEEKDLLEYAGSATATQDYEAWIEEYLEG